MNTGRKEMQARMQQGVALDKVEEGRKRWLATQAKIAGHKRSNKPYSKEWMEQTQGRD